MLCLCFRSLVTDSSQCSIAGSLARYSDLSLTAQSYRFAWVFPTISITGCAVQLYGFEVLHDSRSNCNVKIGMWERTSGNTYKLLAKNAFTTLTATASPVLVRHIFSSPFSYIFDATKTIYFGIKTAQTACRILGVTSTNVGARYRNSNANFPSVGDSRNMDRTRAISVNFRALLAGEKDQQIFYWTSHMTEKVPFEIHAFVECSNFVPFSSVAICSKLIADLFAHPQKYAPFYQVQLG